MSSSIVILPRTSDAFSAYRPSSNAHLDIINPTVRRDAGDKVVRLQLGGAAPSPDIDQLSTCIPLLLSGKPTPISYHAISSTVRYLSAGHVSDMKRVYDAIEAGLGAATSEIERSARRSIMGGEERWLERFAREWDVYIGRVNLVAALFVHLDKVYAQGSILSITELGTNLFRDRVWMNSLVRDKTLSEFLAWVAGERGGEVKKQARADAVGIVKLASTLKVPMLEQAYLDCTREYYDTASAANVASVTGGSMTGTQYVQWALDAEAAELARATTVVSASVGESVVEIVRHETGELKAADVVQKALDEAMYRADTDALARLYAFCIHAKAFTVFAKALHDHIEARIRVVISDPANDPQMIDSTLKLKRFADRAVASLFHTAVKVIHSDAKEDQGDVDDVDMEDSNGSSSGNGKDKKKAKVSGEDRTRQLELEEAVRSGFKAGLGSRQNAPAEWIAKYLDQAMRRGPGAGTSEEANALLDEVIALVGYTRDKDVFRAFYTSGLAKRLLLNKSASDDMERTMIVKLQNEMGDEFTSGDVMMKDLQLSETLIKSYQMARAKNPESFKDKSDFTANVLTESAWPPYPLLKDGWDFKLTPELQSSIDAFTSWYGTQHMNRKLSWRHQLGTVTLVARFDSGRYEIGVSLFQAVVLLQFNEVDVLDFNEIKARTGIESSELIRILQSLALGRKGTRVLIKRPAGKDVEPTDKFAFNKAFSSDKIKFKINQIQQDMSAEESRKTNEQVSIDRVSVLEATIVRIMKARKRLTLQLLIDAVVTDVSKKFPPDVKEIKKRVESLIEREYLQRDEDDRNKLQYLA